METSSHMETVNKKESRMMEIVVLRFGMQCTCNETHVIESNGTNKCCLWRANNALNTRNDQGWHLHKHTWCKKEKTSLHPCIKYEKKKEREWIEKRIEAPDGVGYSYKL